jgi:hypothetical protein
MFDVWGDHRMLHGVSTGIRHLWFSIWNVKHSRIYDCSRAHMPIFYRPKKYIPKLYKRRNEFHQNLFVTSQQNALSHSLTLRFYFLLNIHENLSEAEDACCILYSLPVWNREDIRGNATYSQIPKTKMRNTTRLHTSVKNSIGGNIFKP